MRRTDAEIMEQEAEANPILGDLSHLEWDGHRIRCPACTELRAALLLVQHGPRTEPACPKCYRAHRWATLQKGATGGPKRGGKSSARWPLAAARYQEATAS